MAPLALALALNAKALCAFKTRSSEGNIPCRPQPWPTVWPGMFTTNVGVKVTTAGTTWYNLLYTMSQDVSTCFTLASYGFHEIVMEGYMRHMVSATGNTKEKEIGHVAQKASTKRGLAFSWASFRCLASCRQFAGAMHHAMHHEPCAMHHGSSSTLYTQTIPCHTILLKSWRLSKTAMAATTQPNDYISAQLTGNDPCCPT